LHRTYTAATARGIRRRQGYFNGAPAAPGALMLYTATQIVRDLRRGAPEEPWALVLVWDADTQGPQRSEGLSQSRAEAEALLSVGDAIVVGIAERNREAWVLAGFEPETPEELRRLADVRRLLGFWPNEAPELLAAQDDRAERHAKPVLRALTDGDPVREARCWEATGLDTLQRRGQGCGLAAFLDEVRERLVPQVCGPPALNP
jgi:hypothetical protein